MIPRSRLAVSGQTRDERGTSLVEIMVTMTLCVVVMAVVLTVFGSLNTGAARQNGSIETRAALRQALGEVTRDLRGGTTLHLIGSVRNASEDLRIERTDGLTVRYRTTRTELVRETLRSGRVSSTRTVLDGIPHSDRGSTFRYFTPTGRELVPGDRTLEELNRCTARVDVRLRSEPGEGRSAAELSASVALRGVVPEEVPC